MGRKKIPLSFVEDLLSRADIVDVISNYLSLKQTGRNYMALCPFHPEKTPSFVVSPEKQIFKCFGCGVGGSAITFIQKYENLSFYESVKRLCELSGNEFPSEFSEETNETEKLYESAKEVANFFHQQIEKVKPYLKKREIKDDLSRRFMLGYAPKDYYGKLKLPDKTLKKLNLITEKGKTFFSERLIIPIFNHSGKIVAFGARALKEHQKPKYINSPESEIFNKSSILYGFYQARENILKKKEVIVVEGYFDVISLFKVGIERTVAPMGTSLTEKHAKTLKRYAKKIVLFFDGDEAGEKATLRASELLTKIGVEPFIIKPPEGEDPDSISKADEELLKTLISQPAPLSKYLIKKAKDEPLETRSEFIKTAVSIYSAFEKHDPFKLKKFLSELSVETESDIKWLKSIVKSTLKQPFKTEKKQNQKPLIPEYEKVFIKGIMEGIIPHDIELSPNIFYSNECKKLYLYLKLTKGHLNSVEMEQNDPELSGIVAELAFTNFNDNEIKSALCRILRKEIERKIRSTKEFSLKKRLKTISIKLSQKEAGGIEEIISCIY